MIIIAKKEKVKKTNDERILDQNHIEFESYTFDFLGGRQMDSSKEAKELGTDERSILKTIVLQGSNGDRDYVVVCLPITFEIDLKLVARELNEKQLHLADNKNLINITGYVHGANTPIGINVRKGFPIYFDERIQEFDKIWVSAGKVGRSVGVKREELVKLVKGHYINIEK